MHDIHTVAVTTPRTAERILDDAGGKTRSGTALEVAALREEVDVVNDRLDDVDERVAALEATHPEDRLRADGGASPSFVGRGRGNESTANDSKGATAPNSTASQAPAAPPDATPEAAAPSVSTSPFQGSFIMVPVSGEQIAHLVGLATSAEAEPGRSSGNEHEGQGEWRMSSTRGSTRGRASRR
jgi:hypothetical protein